MARARVGPSDEEHVFSALSGAVLEGQTRELEELAGRWDLGRWVADLRQRNDPRFRPVQLFRQAAHITELLRRELELPR